MSNGGGDLIPSVASRDEVGLSDDTQVVVVAL